jgi:hypothetical protein
MTRTNPREPLRDVIYVRELREVVDRLAQLADRNGRSMSAEARLAIRRHVEHDDAERER